MWILRYDSRGVLTIEMTFIMPIILIVIMNFIYLFIALVNDSRVQSLSYDAIYSYMNEAAMEKSEELTDYINNGIIGASNTNAVVNNDNSQVTVDISTVASSGDMYSYESRSCLFKTEFEACTDRLRRWQLYGNILSE